MGEKEPTIHKLEIYRAFYVGVSHAKKKKKTELRKTRKRQILLFIYDLGTFWDVRQFHLLNVVKFNFQLKETSLFHINSQFYI